MTHICVGKLTIIGSDNGLSPGRRQAIIWTNAGILLIGPSGTNSNEILIGMQTFSFTKMQLKMSSAKWRPFCLGFNELINGRNWNPPRISCQLELVRLESGPVFNLWLGKIAEHAAYRLFHWLRPCSAIDRKRALQNECWWCGARYVIKHLQPVPCFVCDIENIKWSMFFVYLFFF